MIRPAVREDAPAIAALGSYFHADHPLGKTILYDGEFVERAFRGLLRERSSTVIVADHRTMVVGMIAGTIVPTIFNPEACVASEIVWYVHPDYRHTTYGIRLLDALENWALMSGASHLCMFAHALHPWISAIYVRRGYDLLETHYMKALL